MCSFSTQFKPKIDQTKFCPLKMLVFSTKHSSILSTISKGSFKWHQRICQIFIFYLENRYLKWRVFTILQNNNYIHKYIYLYKNLIKPYSKIHPVLWNYWDFVKWLMSLWLSTERDERYATDCPGHNHSLHINFRRLILKETFEVEM